MHRPGIEPGSLDWQSNTLPIELTGSVVVTQVVIINSLNNLLQMEKK